MRIEHISPLVAELWHGQVQVASFGRVSQVQDYRVVSACFPDDILKQMGVEKELEKLNEKRFKFPHVPFYCDNECAGQMRIDEHLGSGGESILFFTCFCVKCRKWWHIPSGDKVHNDYVLAFCGPLAGVRFEGVGPLPKPKDEDEDEEKT